jgi:hypothetical protein
MSFGLFGNGERVSNKTTNEPNNSITNELLSRIPSLPYDQHNPKSPT